MPIVKFTSLVQDGKLPGINKNTWSYVLKQMEGRTLEVTLDYHTNKRSNAQNAYYWPVVVEFTLEGLIDAGYRRDELSPELVHEYLKDKFLKHLRRRIRNPVTKKYIVKKPSTAELNTWEFMDYLDAVRIWAASFLSISIPDPDRQWREKAEADYRKALAAGLITVDIRNSVRIALMLEAA